MDGITEAVPKPLGVIYPTRLQNWDRLREMLRSMGLKRAVFCTLGYNYANTEKYLAHNTE